MSTSSKGKAGQVDGKPPKEGWRRWLRPKRVVLVIVLLALGLVLVIGGQALRLVFAKLGTFPQGVALLAEAVEGAQSEDGSDRLAPNAQYALLEAHAIYLDQYAMHNQALIDAHDARLEQDPDLAELFHGVGVDPPAIDFTTIGMDVSDLVESLPDEAGYEQELAYYDEQERAARAAIEPMLDAGLREAMARVAAAPRSAMDKQPAGQPLIGVLLPELSNARALARFQVARMRVAVESGDVDEFVRAFEEGLACARVTSTQPVLISQLVRFAILNLVLDEAVGPLVSGEIAPGAADGMLRALRRQAGTPIDPAFGLIGERLFITDVVHRTHTDDGNGDGSFLPGEFHRMMTAWGGVGPGPVLGNALGVFAPSKRETLDDVTRFYDGLIYAAAAPTRQIRDDRHQRCRDRRIRHRVCETREPHLAVDAAVV